MGEIRKRMGPEERAAAAKEWAAVAADMLRAIEDERITFAEVAGVARRVGRLIQTIVDDRKDDDDTPDAEEIGGTASRGRVRDLTPDAEE